MNVERSVTINGNLSDGPITYSCYPPNELDKKWRIAIGSVIFDSKDSISATAVISCNFITHKERKPNGDIDICEQPMNIFHLKTNAQAPRGIYQFCKDQSP